MALTQINLPLEGAGGPTLVNCEVAAAGGGLPKRIKPFDTIVAMIPEAEDYTPFTSDLSNVGTSPSVSWALGGTANRSGGRVYFPAVTDVLRHTNGTAICGPSSAWTVAIKASFKASSGAYDDMIMGTATWGFSFVAAQSEGGWIVQHVPNTNNFSVQSYIWSGGAATRFVYTFSAPELMGTDSDDHMLVITYDGQNTGITNFRVYVDGEYRAAVSTTWQGAWLAPNNVGGDGNEGVTINNSWHQHPYAAPGCVDSIDWFAHWDRVLTDEEIEGFYGTAEWTTAAAAGGSVKSIIVPGIVTTRELISPASTIINEPDLDIAVAGSFNVKVELTGAADYIATEVGGGPAILVDIATGGDPRRLAAMEPVPVVGVVTPVVVPVGIIKEN